jgi:5-methylcytosine-specific restriction endonuclease McrA
MEFEKLVKKRISDASFSEVCRNSKSMAAAASTLRLHFNSFKKRAIELGCHNANQCGKGIKKQTPQIPLNEIIVEGKYPHYQSYKLKNRLYKERIKQRSCEVCGTCKWQNKLLALELNHLDGNRQNHLLNNLKLLCPNCHSQTDTFRSKNRKI